MTVNAGAGDGSDRPLGREARQVKILTERPPFYGRIVTAIGEPGPDTVFTYGDIVYSPGSAILSMDVMVHEAVHAEQQDELGGPERWWDQYLDPDLHSGPPFRLLQELEAYQVQWRFVKMHVKDRNKLASIRRQFANILAGPLYGNLTTAMEAWRALES